MTAPAPARLGAQVSLKEPDAGARRETLRAFLAMGFQVFEADDGVTLSIQGPPALFAQVFHQKAADLANRTLRDDLKLATPPALTDRVAAIHLLPPPERYGGVP